MKTILVSVAVVCSSALAYGQGTNGTATGEKASNFIMGGMSAVMGGVIIKMAAKQAATDCTAKPPLPGCTMDKMMEYVMGPMMIMSGIMDIAQGMGQQGSIDGTMGGIPGSGALPGDGTGNGGGTGVPAPVTNALQTALGQAADAGINPTTQAGLDAAAANAGVSPGDESSASQNAMANLDPGQLAMVAEAKKAAAAQFSISSVGTEGGGGGGMVAKGNKADQVDVNALLASMAGGDPGRGPASVGAMTKDFNGEHIGVASGNIFEQVTRRYQAKIAARTFIDVVVREKGFGE